MVLLGCDMGQTPSQRHRPIRVAVHPLHILTISFFGPAAARGSMPCTQTPHSYRPSSDAKWLACAMNWPITWWRDRHRVFSGFFQAETPGVQRPGGAGVGLAVADRLVRLMGSAIAVSSTLGEGSTFTFLLRVMLAPEDISRPLYPEMPEES